MNQAEHDLHRERAARSAGLVAWIFHMEPAALFRETRGDAEEGFARHVAIHLTYFAWDYESFEPIGVGFFGKHRSSIEHAVNRIDQLREGSPDFDAAIRWMLDLLRKGDELGTAYLRELMALRPVAVADEPEAVDA